MVILDTTKHAWNKWGRIRQVALDKLCHPTDVPILCGAARPFSFHIVIAVVISIIIIIIIIIIVVIIIMNVIIFTIIIIIDIIIIISVDN